jgi:lipoate-protein ligase A
VEPANLLGLQFHLMRTVSDGATAPLMLLYQFPGNVISLGRYHLYGGPSSRGAIGAYRRLTGGRIINPGAGWIGCSLVLPSRAALLAERDARIRPEQVMNRYTRGALVGLRKLGADCFYPGRDTITCAGRELAMCTFEEDSEGALLFELFIAAGRGLDSLPVEMEQFDPEGTLCCRFYDSGNSTHLARELGRTPDFEELADALETGYRSMFAGTRRRDLTAAEVAASDAQADALGTRWLGWRRPDTSLNLAARLGVQLGSMEAHLAVTGDRIGRVEFYGDFIANSAGLAKFEARLTGEPLDPISLTSAALETYGDGSNFILGCGDVSNLALMIRKAS